MQATNLFTRVTQRSLQSVVLKLCFQDRAALDGQWSNEQVASLLAGRYVVPSIAYRMACAIRSVAVNF